MNKIKKQTYIGLHVILFIKNFQWSYSNPHLLCGDALPLSYKAIHSPRNPQLPK